MYSNDLNINNNNNNNNLKSHMTHDRSNNAENLAINYILQYIQIESSCCT